MVKVEVDTKKLPYFLRLKLEGKKEELKKVAIAGGKAKKGYEKPKWVDDGVTPNGIPVQKLVEDE